VRFRHLTYMEALNLRVRVLDATAITTCMDNDLPIRVLNLWGDDSLQKAVLGQEVGTTISH
jgi:uridylate kinase